MKTLLAAHKVRADVAADMVMDRMCWSFVHALIRDSNEHSF
jgi:hypothetical protein